MRRLLTLTALSSALLLAACGEDVVEEADVERQARDALTEQVGQAPKEIDCPGDLTAKEGEKMTCTLVAGDGSEVDVTVTVTSVDGENARFDVEVGEEVRR